jgi:hypothetical protein
MPGHSITVLAAHHRLSSGPGPGMGLCEGKKIIRFAFETKGFALKLVNFVEYYIL